MHHPGCRSEPQTKVKYPYINGTVLPGTAGGDIGPDYDGQFEGAVSLSLSGDGRFLAVGAARSRNEV